jgi:hypothetical protein
MCFKMLSIIIIVFFFKEKGYGKFCMQSLSWSVPEIPTSLLRYMKHTNTKICIYCTQELDNGFDLFLYLLDVGF